MAFSKVFITAVLTLALGACASSGGIPGFSGSSISELPSEVEKPAGFATRTIGIPILAGGASAYQQIIPGVAVSHRHFNLWRKIASSPDYDIAFHRKDGPVPKISREPVKVGERVAVFGASILGGERYLLGTVEIADVQVCREEAPPCQTERERRPERMFGIAVDPGFSVGSGFSGGSVARLSDGVVIGMAFAGTVGEGGAEVRSPSGERIFENKNSAFAYSMRRILGECRELGIPECR